MGLPKLGSGMGPYCGPVLLSGHLDLIGVFWYYSSIGKELPSVLNMAWTNWIVSIHHVNGDHAEKQKNLKNKEFEINRTTIGIRT